MKNKIFLFYLPMILFMGMIGGCAKTENFFAYNSDKINKKIIPGTWDIVQMEIWIFDDVQTNSVLDYMSYENIGNFEFKEDGVCHLNLNNGSLDANYLTLYSTTAWEWAYISGSFQLTEYFNGNVTYLDKKNMTIHMPWTLSPYLTERIIINKSVEFRFKLKKQ